jgi:Arc/MetJ-type ribon-helix-helix transcriptional regulator
MSIPVPEKTRRVSVELSETMAEWVEQTAQAMGPHVSTSYVVEHAVRELYRREMKESTPISPRRKRAVNQ